MLNAMDTETNQAYVKRQVHVRVLSSELCDNVPAITQAQGTTFFFLEEAGTFH